MREKKTVRGDGAGMKSLVMQRRAGASEGLSRGRVRDVHWTGFLNF